MTPEELKAFGANIKNLPPEDRKAAGLKFKEMVSLVKRKPVLVSVNVDKKGKELWSYCRGTPNEVVGYENCIVLPSGIVWGDNLKYIGSR